VGLIKAGRGAGHTTANCPLEISNEMCALDELRTRFAHGKDFGF
jgi:hypothetical protein